MYDIFTFIKQVLGTIYLSMNNQLLIFAKHNNDYGMKYLTRPKVHESLIYIALWLIVLLAPLVDFYLTASNNTSVTFSWNTVFRGWINLLPFVVLFLVNNYYLAPRFLLKRKVKIYLLYMIGVLALFIIAEGLIQHPKGRPDFETKRFERFDGPHPDYQNRHMMPLSKPQKGMNDMPFPRAIFFLPRLLMLFIALLMLGFNDAVKLLFKSQRDEEAMRSLENHNLQQELEYLKYQINPHFFMNTLNNIHALVDIDSDKAKDTILELSKLMRYVLYDGSKRTIMLSREIEFLNHYIALMRLRYIDAVTIVTNFEVESGDIQIPPLLFISFVENAFKHGISYQSDSFIRINMKTEEDCLYFSCINSNCGKNSDPYSGIGLENVSKRLKLLYGENYFLSIENNPDIFKISLKIPIQ